MPQTCPGHVPGTRACPKSFGQNQMAGQVLDNFCSVTCRQKGLMSSHGWLKNSATYSFYCVFRFILLCRIWILFLIYFYDFFCFLIALRKIFSGLAHKKFGDKNILTKMYKDILRTCPMSCPVSSIFSGQARPFPTK